MQPPFGRTSGYYRCSSIAHAVAAFVVLVVGALVSIFPASAQGGPGGDIGEEAAQRLQQERENDYRAAKKVGDLNAVKQNMDQLFKQILISGKGDGKADQWHSPHLRDSMIVGENRTREAVRVRSKTRPFAGIAAYCFFTPSWLIPANYTACPLFNCGAPHVWHGEPFTPHRPIEACFPLPPTTPYAQLTEDSNFKLCCVREADKNKASEQIAAIYPTGNGWAGLFEFYYPTAAVGWENDRTTTMIADQKKVQECVQQSDPLMEGEQAQKWVAEAIERNLKTVGGEAGVAQQLQQQIAQDIAKLRPEDRRNRFADSLQGEGLTMRVNFATMDPEYRKKLAERFCMWPNQFDKLMTSEDTVFKSDKGGGLSLQGLDKIPIWSNYCPEGVELMTNPELSAKLENVDATPTDFVMGMKAWKQDPLYCQMMQLENQNMPLMKFDQVIRTYGKQQLNQQAVGNTCLQGGNLNVGMVPVSLYRNAVVERRTAIADHVMGFMIAGALAPKMIAGQKSYYKRFEPQPYSMTKYPFDLQLFIGKKFAGGGKNELGQECQGLQGENYQFQDKADRLYISNKTHQPFTQKMIDDKNDINKYVQEWADQQKDKIRNRGLDDKSQNYAAAYRIMATCPSGMVVWEPPPDEHNAELLTNIQNFCRKENHGGVP